MRQMKDAFQVSNDAETSRSSALYIFLFSLLGALLSLGISGFIWGINNNIFHLPIVAELYNEPQFAGDTFIQSLRYYASGWWLLFKNSAGWLPPPYLFFAGILFSRLLTFWGFLACVEVLGVSKLKDKLFITLVLACTALLYGNAYAGDGGLFIEYFTQSEICNGLSLLCLAAAARRRIVSALVLNGLVFFINAFVAAWNFVPLLLIALMFLREGSLKAVDLLRRALLGFVFFFVLAMPVLMNMLANPSFGKPVSFSYLHYLAEFWPKHFLFYLIPLRERIKAIILLFIAVYLLWKNGRNARVFLLALLGYAAVFVLGIAAPYVTQSALILNLHLLRVTVFFHLLAALGGAVLIVRWLGESDCYRSRVLAPLGFAICCIAHVTFFFFPFVAESERHSSLVAGIQGRARKWPRLIPVCGLICAFVGLSGQIDRNYSKIRWTLRNVTVYQQLGLWARSTPAETTFLLPVTGFYGKGSDPTALISTTGALVNPGIFEYVSHRKVWVDWKRGAAVLWYPPYYATWHQRLSEVVALSSLEQELTYAQLHGIGYVVDRCVASEVPNIEFNAGPLCVFRTRTYETPAH